MATNLPDLDELRALIRAHRLADEATCVSRLTELAGLSPEDRGAIVDRAADLVHQIRTASDPGMMEVFLSEYGLTTQEGIALMCLAEALLRVPDADTIDALIEDKIAPGDWARHLGRSSSPLVNASTWALLLTGKVLEDDDRGLAGTLRGAVKRLGEPVIRTAVARAMKEMGRQFVLGRDIGEAMARAKAQEVKGYTYSYDMLGEAARSDRDARRYHLAYSEAIAAISAACVADDIRQNPGISVKLSALHPRYEQVQRDRVLTELVPRVSALAHLAKSAGMGFNIDAEEADRLDLSLDVIGAVLADPGLKGWDGFGVVVQAFGQRAPFVLDWLYALAGRHDRRVMVRLVKGAYWDTEIKLAQTLGINGFPVFTRKASTDVSYIGCARKLLRMTDRIYPQFATHNAHTVAAILHMAPDGAYEFQRLHGMGTALHDLVLRSGPGRCRIYAPVGAHRDLLAYLVRRLLENGANSSFVNQIVNAAVPVRDVAADPFDALAGGDIANPAIRRPPAIYGPDRSNARGWNHQDPADLAGVAAARAAFASHRWTSSPIPAGVAQGAAPVPVVNPAAPGDVVGDVIDAAEADVAAALDGARLWDLAVADRAATLNRAADLLEDAAGEIFELLAREAGKTIIDAIAELREAVDFLRYYSAEAQALDRQARGVFVCISPWNFPLAIFVGQISAALACGNSVIAKPAEATPLIAARAVEILHQAGVPRTALQLLPGQGGTVGRALVRSPAIAGVCFTGSTATAQAIHRDLAGHGNPAAQLVAETGGLNAMIVDSTALPEQAVRDIVASAFQSAGQRCSALRVLYVQEEIARDLSVMLFGAMDALVIGNPAELATDVGPIINAEAAARIRTHVDTAHREGRVLHTIAAPGGNFVGPTVISVKGIADLQEEIFGPILHLARFKAEHIEQVVDAVNASGYGLTFGLHTRIDARVQATVDRLHVGNIYVNRNQIGAIVGSQPFGGEGMSGTGPKAGGPDYLHAFSRIGRPRLHTDVDGMAANPDDVRAAIKAARATRHRDPTDVTDLPGPTGELNRLSVYPRGVFLCLGPGLDLARTQMAAVHAAGAPAVAVAPGASQAFEVSGVLDAADLSRLDMISGLVFQGSDDSKRHYRRALADRPGPILPLITDPTDSFAFRLERHLCVDTTASGGNAQLLAI